MNKTSYNEIAHQWADKRGDALISKLVVDFADKVSPGGKILDIGCGTGIPLTKYLCERNFFVTGIDLSERMIAIAQSSMIKGAEFVCSDFFDFESAEKFDGVLAWDSLWHFHKNKQESIYPVISDVLRPGGYLLFTHGNIEGEHIDTMMGEPFYYSSLSKEQVYGLLGTYGFEINFAREDYMENGSHRALVVLAKKI